MNRGDGRARRASAAALLFFTGFLGVGLSGAGAGCAREMSHQAVETAMNDIIAQQEKTPPDEAFAYIGSQRAAAGVLSALDQPEQREQLRRIVSSVVSEAVETALRTALAGKGPGPAGGTGERGVADALVAQLAETATSEVGRQLTSALAADGEISAGVSAVGQRATVAAVGGALAELFPSCAGVTGAAEVAACRRQALNETARETAASVAAGFRDKLGVPLLIVAVVIGLGVGILAHWLWTLRLRRGRTFQEA